MEMKDHQLSTPNQAPEALQPKVNQISSVQINSVSKSLGKNSTQTEDVHKRGKNIPMTETGPWNKDSPQQAIGKTEPQKSIDSGLYGSQTPELVPTHCASGICTSNIKQDRVSKSEQIIKMEDLNQSEKPKCSRNRRQRRKGAGQHLVGLPHSPSAPPPVLLWFRRDLRLCDNPALIGSLQLGAPVIPVFIWSPEEEEGQGVTVAAGGACKLFKDSGRKSFK